MAFQVVANYVHSLGLKFGLYVTPGISQQAVAQNTPILGTFDTAGEIASAVSENNYNCGGMVGINYSKPGAQAFINSWADEFVSWGMDYVKLDGVGCFDLPDVKAWSEALRQRAGRWPSSYPTASLSNTPRRGHTRNGWRTPATSSAIAARGDSYPLTD